MSIRTVQIYAYTIIFQMNKLVVLGFACAISVAVWALHRAPNTKMLVVDEQRPVYALVTLTLTPDYVVGSQALCLSIRKHSVPPDVELVAYIPLDYEERGVYPQQLHCFDRVETLVPVHVSKPPSFFRFKEQYVKLRLWSKIQYKKIVYLDSDFLVVQLDPLISVLRSPAIHFGAVNDFQAGEFREWWNGGFMVIEPSEQIYSQLMNEMEPFIAADRFDTEKAEQGYVSAFFKNMGYSLPTVFNLNLAILDQRPDTWRLYYPQAVAIHFTLEKPWVSSRTGEPFDQWHALFK